MLAVVVDGVTTFVAGQPAIEKLFEVVKRDPEPIERCRRKNVALEFAHRIPDGGDGTDLHGIRDVVVIAPVRGLPEAAGQKLSSCIHNEIRPHALLAALHCDMQATVPRGGST